MGIQFFFSGTHCGYSWVCYVGQCSPGLARSFLLFAFGNWVGVRLLIREDPREVVLVHDCPHHTTATEKGLLLVEC